MSYKDILLDKKDGVALLTMNRPEKMNTFNDNMREEIFRAIIEIEEDPAIRATVVTGAGRAYCAGADLSAGAEKFTATGRKRAESPWVPESKTKFFFSLNKPIIAAINGPAAGGGVTMPLLFDIRLAGESARLGFVFNRRGLLPEYNSVWVLSRLIGTSQAAELLYTGRVIGAEEALRFGLVNRVLPDDELVPAALELAGEIARKAAPVSTALTKRMLFSYFYNDDVDGCEAETDRLFKWARDQPDAREGIAAFLEKRPPRWTMNVPEDMPDF